MPHIRSLLYIPPLQAQLDFPDFSTTGAVLGGGRSVFTGSGALGGSNAPVVNLSSEYMQQGKASQGMSSNAFGDDSKVSTLPAICLFPCPVVLLPCLCYSYHFCRTMTEACRGDRSAAHASIPSVHQTRAARSASVLCEAPVAHIVGRRSLLASLAHCVFPARAACSRHPHARPLHHLSKFYA